jgi:hypothetical protein
VGTDSGVATDNVLQLQKRRKSNIGTNCYKFHSRDKLKLCCLCFAFI